MSVCPAPTIGSLRAGPESAAGARHAGARQSLPTGLPNPFPGQSGASFPFPEREEKGPHHRPPPPPRPGSSHLPVAVETQASHSGGFHGREGCLRTRCPQELV